MSKSSAPLQISPQRQRYDAATLRRDAIGKQMRDWPGARSGERYDNLRAEWVAAQREAEAAYDALTGHAE